MEPVIVIIFGTFVGLFILAIGWSVRSTRRQAEQRREQIALSGFHPCTDSAPLLDRVRRLYHRDSPLKLQNVYEQRGLDYTVYLFDAYSTGDDSGALFTNAVAVVSPELALPRFALMPRLDETNWLAQAANRLMASLMARALQPVPSPEHSDLQQHYNVFGLDTETVRSFFEQQGFYQQWPATAAARTEVYMVDGEGDTLVLSVWGNARSAVREAGALNADTQAAMSFFNRLRRR